MVLPGFPSPKFGFDWTGGAPSVGLKAPQGLEWTANVESHSFEIVAVCVFKSGLSTVDPYQ